MKTKYTPTSFINLGYIVLMLIGIMLTIGRWYSLLDPAFVVFNKDIHMHISNLSLSLILYLQTGYFWLLLGVKFRYIVILGGGLIAANVLCETLVSVLNTPDILDAVYGVFGIMISFIFLFICNKYGLREDR